MMIHSFYKLNSMALLQQQRLPPSAMLLLHPNYFNKRSSSSSSLKNTVRFAQQKGGGSSLHASFRVFCCHFSREVFQEAAVSSGKETRAERFHQPVVPPSSNVSLSTEEALSKLEEFDRKIERLVKRLEVLSHVSEVQMKINRFNLSYTSGKMTVRRNRRFRKDLLEAYGYDKQMMNSGVLRCLLLNRPVPSNSLVAAHLFKHEWARVAESVMGLEDINSRDNGLMLFSPIEHCFDNLRLCFLVGCGDEENDDDITCHVLDPHLLDKTLVSVSRAVHWRRSDDRELANLTFAHIDGRKLTFTSDHRPNRDVLNFHARQARAHAIAKGWIESCWDFEDFYSDPDRWEKLKPWITQSIIQSE